MILKILLKLWPALIPILLYLLWIWLSKKLNKKSYIEAEFQEIKKDDKKSQETTQNSANYQKIGDFSLKNTIFIAVIYSSLVITILSFLFFAISH